MLEQEENRQKPMSPTPRLRDCHSPAVRVLKPKWEGKGRRKRKTEISQGLGEPVG